MFVCARALLALALALHTTAVSDFALPYFFASTACDVIDGVQVGDKIGTWVLNVTVEDANDPTFTMQLQLQVGAGRWSINRHAAGYLSIVLCLCAMVMRGVVQTLLEKQSTTYIVDQYSPFQQLTVVVPDVNPSWNAVYFINITFTDASTNPTSLKRLQSLDVPADSGCQFDSKVYQAQSNHLRLLACCVPDAWCCL
jgi:hypothetical protein